MRKTFYQFMKSMPIMAIVTLLSFQSYAQNILTGTITDAKGSIIGASIIIDGTSVGTSSGANGGFRLESSRPLPWDVTVSYIGYKSIKKTITASGTVFNASLEEDESSLNEVVVSASRKAEKVQDAPASVSVISAKSLQAATSATDPSA